MKLLSSFQLATQVLIFQSINTNLVYEVLRNYRKINKFYSWNQQSRLKC